MFHFYFPPSLFTLTCCSKERKSHKKEFSVPADQSCTLCALALFTKLQKLIKTFYGSLSLLLPWRDTWKKTVIEFGWATICWRNLNDSVPIFFYKCFERPVNGDHWSPTKIKLWREMKVTCCKLQTMLASMVYRMISVHKISADDPVPFRKSIDQYDRWWSSVSKLLHSQLIDNQSGI